MGKGLHYYMYSTLYIFMCITRVLASISVRLFNSNESVCIKVYYYMVVCICIYVIHAPPIELRHDCEERRKSIYVNVYLCIIGNYYYITIVIWIRCYVYLYMNVYKGMSVCMCVCKSIYRYKWMYKRNWTVKKRIKVMMNWGYYYICELKFFFGLCERVYENYIFVDWIWELRVGWK